MHGVALKLSVDAYTHANIVMLIFFLSTSLAVTDFNYTWKDRNHELGSCSVENPDRTC